MSKNAVFTSLTPPLSFAYNLAVTEIGIPKGNYFKLIPYAGLGQHCFIEGSTRAREVR